MDILFIVKVSILLATIGLTYLIARYLKKNYKKIKSTKKFKEIRI